MLEKRGYRRAPSRRGVPFNPERSQPPAVHYAHGPENSADPGTVVPDRQSGNQHSGHHRNRPVPPRWKGSPLPDQEQSGGVMDGEGKGQAFFSILQSHLPFSIRQKNEYGEGSAQGHRPGRI